MTKEGAIHQFWSGFGVAAYDENTVPDDAALPYITYEVVTSDFDHEVISSVDIWGRGRSWTEVTNLKDAIADYIGLGGATAKYDGGMLWIKKDNTFARRTPDDNPDIRHITLNIITEYISEV